MTTPWYKDAIFYELYVRAFKDTTGNGNGDLRGVIEKLDYLKHLGVDCIWLLPIYPSPLKDGGYDVADFCGIHPDYGVLEDFDELIKEAHQRGLRVITDLVVNHTSDEHDWFKESRSSLDNPKRDWYVWSDTDQRYVETRIIFLDTESSNWEFDERTNQYYWHRFYASQPDLNFDNPEVQVAILDVMRFWLDKGIDGFRVDAVPYLYEREGTNCENLPETHIYLKEMRRFIDEGWPEAVMLCEANQPAEDVVDYFGDGDEFHMGFHFPVMPRIYMALRSGDGTKIREIMEATPPIPDGCQWCVFLRNHDELTVEMVSEEERQWMWREYAPEPRMKLNLGIRRRLAPLLDNNPAKIMLANRLLFSLPGTPIIYYGDEIGMGDNIALHDRDGVRTPMQWDDSHNAGFSDAPDEQLYSPVISGPAYGYGYERLNVANQIDDPDSMLNRMRGLIALRKQHPAFSRGELEFLDTHNPAVLAFIREAEGSETIIAIHNLTDSGLNVALDLGRFTGRAVVDVLDRSADHPPIEAESTFLNLAPYQSLWLLVEG